MTDTDNVDSETPPAPSGADAPPPTAGDADGGTPPAPPEDNSDAEAMRAFMEEYRADKKAKAEAEAAAAEAAAKKKKVPAPEPKKKATPPKEEAPKDEAPKEKAYGSARWFNRKVKKNDG